MTNQATSAVVGGTTLPVRAFTASCKVPNVGQRIANLETHLKKLQETTGSTKPAHSNGSPSLTAYVDAMLEDLRTKEVAVQQSASQRLNSAASTPVVTVAAALPSTLGSATAPSYQRCVSARQSGMDSEAMRLHSQRTSQPSGLHLSSPRQDRSTDQFPVGVASMRHVQNASFRHAQSGRATPRQTSTQSVSKIASRMVHSSGSGRVVGARRLQPHLQATSAGVLDDTRTSSVLNERGSLKTSWSNADGKASQKRPPMTKLLWSGPRQESSGSANATQLTSPAKRTGLSARQGPARALSADGRFAMSPTSRQSSHSARSPVQPSATQAQSSSVCLPQSLTALWQSQSASSITAPAAPTLTTSSTSSQLPSVGGRSWSLPPRQFSDGLSMLQHSHNSARFNASPRPASFSGSFVAAVPVPRSQPGSLRLSPGGPGSLRLSPGGPNTLTMQCSSPRIPVTLGSLTASVGTPIATPQASFVASCPIVPGASILGATSHRHTVNNLNILKAGESNKGLSARSLLPPVPAFKFKADCSDMMDMTMSWTLCKLDSKSSASLWLRRLAPGKYEIDGRRVSVVWHEGKRKKKELAASEDDVPGSVPVPLLDYLKQAACVASFMQHGRPLHPNVSKGWDGAEYDSVDPDRVQSMLFACQQAGVPVHPRPPSRDSEDSQIVQL